MLFKPLSPFSNLSPVVSSTLTVPSSLFAIISLYVGLPPCPPLSFVSLGSFPPFFPTSTFYLVLLFVPIITITIIPTLILSLPIVSLPIASTIHSCVIGVKIVYGDASPSNTKDSIELVLGGIEGKHDNSSIECWFTRGHSFLSTRGQSRENKILESKASTQEDIEW